MVYVDGEKITQTTKTEAGERVIVLNKQAVMDLQMLRKQFDEQSEFIEQRMAEELRQAELDRLIYNEPLTYAQLVLSGEIEEYLKGKPLHKLED